MHCPRMRLAVCHAQPGLSHEALQGGGSEPVRRVGEVGRRCGSRPERDERRGRRGQTALHQAANHPLNQGDHDPASRVSGSDRILRSARGPGQRGAWHDRPLRGARPRRSLRQGGRREPGRAAQAPAARSHGSQWRLLRGQCPAGQAAAARPGRRCGRCQEGSRRKEGSRSLRRCQARGRRDDGHQSGRRSAGRGPEGAAAQADQEGGQEAEGGGQEGGGQASSDGRDTVGGRDHRGHAQRGRTEGGRPARAGHGGARH
mmetsp:Transcript_29842/g.75056  ORF Transcript_29842/g.75056 Transcript_29842/m.75056 type:complete len:259 (+) Transcript_29842:1255-2031(+)